MNSPSCLRVALPVPLLTQSGGAQMTERADLVGQAIVEVEYRGVQTLARETALIYHLGLESLEPAVLLSVAAPSFATMTLGGATVAHLIGIGILQDVVVKNANPLLIGLDSPFFTLPFTLDEILAYLN